MIGTWRLLRDGDGKRNIYLLAIVSGLAIGLLAVAIVRAGSKWQFVLAMLLVLAVVTLIARDRWLLLLVLVIIGIPFELKISFSQSETILTGAIAYFYTTIDVLLFAIYVYWIATGRFWSDAKRTFFSTPNVLALLVLFGALPSLANAVAIHRSFWELNRMFWAYGLFFYSLNSFRKTRYARSVVGALMVIAVAESVMAILEGVFGRQLGLAFLGENVQSYVASYDSLQVVRPTGTLVDPNTLAGILALLASVALGVYFFDRRLLPRLVCGAVCALSIFAVIITYSRSGMIALALDLLLVLFMGMVARRVELRAVLLLAAAAAVVAGLAWLQIGDRMMTRLGKQDPEIAARFQLNWVAADMFIDHPIEGVGLNNFRVVESEYEPLDIVMKGVEVHSVYLVILAETGLAGLLPLLAYIYVLYRRTWPLVMAPDATVAALVIGLLAGITGILVAEVSSFALRLNVSQSMFWLFSGLLFAIGFQQNAVAKRTALPRRTNR